MSKVLKYDLFVNEMAKIEKKGKSLKVDNVPLKNIKTSDIGENILYWRNEKSNFMFTEGYTMVWFLDDSENAKYYKDGNNFLFFPHARFSFDSSPITDIWLKNTPIQKHVIGAIQAFTSDKQIFIDMMSVRKGYMQNGINNHMINTLIDAFPNAVVKFSAPTEMGKNFIKKYYPNAKIEGVLSK